MIVIYGRDNCPSCKIAENIAKAHKLPYEYVNISNSDEARERMFDVVGELTGSPPRTVPQIVQKNDDGTYTYVGADPKLILSI